MERQDADHLCTICQEGVTNCDRSRVKLHCGHHFHLGPYNCDCIGSAFNAKGAMECPNCRKVEKGQWWRFPNSPRPSPELNVDGLVNHGDAYDPTYSESAQFWFAGFSRDVAAASLDSFISYLHSGSSLIYQPNTEEHGISSTRSMDSPSSSTHRPYPYSYSYPYLQPTGSSARRVELLSQNMNTYIRGASNQGQAGSSSNRPHGG